MLTQHASLKRHTSPRKWYRMISGFQWRVVGLHHLNSGVLLRSQIDTTGVATQKLPHHISKSTWQYRAVPSLTHYRCTYTDLTDAQD